MCIAHLSSIIYIASSNDRSVDQRDRGEPSSRAADAALLRHADEQRAAAGQSVHQGEDINWYA